MAAPPVICRPDTSCCFCSPLLARATPSCLWARDGSKWPAHLQCAAQRRWTRGVARETGPDFDARTGTCRCVLHTGDRVAFKDVVSVLDAIYSAKRQVRGADGAARSISVFQTAFAAR